MSKYDFELDLDSQNSLSIIIDMIKPNSKILEFGPANGRLTKHLSQKMNCEVDIVEIDEEAGKEAAQYSHRSFIGNTLGDIEKYKWLEEVENERYDYVIFADVLEHLHLPKKVLINCKKILKDDGSIVVSIPNIAHNSVVIDLINDEFKYNNVGLLDNTHISFFSYNSLVRMIDETGYQSVVKKATYCRVGENEIKNTYDSVSKEFAKELRKREKGNIYQFIFKLKKKEFVATGSTIREINLDRNAEYVFTCYIKENFDSSYTESKSIKQFINPDHNIIELELSKFKQLNGLRLDILEANCLIKIKDIYTIVNGEKIEINVLETNGIEIFEKTYLFATNDPQIYLNTKGIDIKKVYFECEFIDYDSEKINKYEVVLNKIINNNNLNLKEKEDAIQNLNSSLVCKDDQIINLTNNLVEKEISIEELINSIEEKENLIRDLNNTLHQKENIIKEHELMIPNIDKLNSELEYYKTHYHAAINQREELKIKLFELQNNYNIISTSTCWKMTKPVRIILDTIKSILKSNKYTYLFCKGIKSIKNNGLSFTVNKVRDKVRKNSRVELINNNERIMQENTRFEKKIKFSIIVPLYNTPKNFLSEMINSCINQTYGDWELCLADGSDEKHRYVGKIVKKYMKKDSRIKYKLLEENKGISENTNECIKMANGEYIALFDHDDLLHPTALFEYMNVICNKDADFIYCDEDKFESNVNKCFDPYFKPDFAIDNLRANNYICHFTVFKKELLDEIGVFRKEFDGSQDHDMILRLVEKAHTIVHVPKILYHWRVSSSSVASDPYAKPYTIKAGINAVTEHLERCNLKGKVESSKVHPNIYRIKYDIIGNPLISILIPNKDHVVDLSRCINSIIEKSTYKNIEIIVIENNSTEKETFDYYDNLEKYDNVKVITYESNGKFNYSAINNFGVKYAKGDHLLFLNNDIEIISENWLEEMLMYSQREDVGAVGAKLYYPNDTIQHAGLGIGLLTLAGHYHRNFDRNSTGYMGNLFYCRNVSGVTAACVMVRKNIFNEINGFDEAFEVAFNDVDLCMRIGKEGYLIVWTPYAEAYHYESISRGYEDTPEKQARFNGEVERFQERWKKELEEGDPYYNANLTLDREDFSLKIN